MATEETWHANLKVRPRRLRLSQNMRRLVRETKLTSDDFIYPLFVRHGRASSSRLNRYLANASCPWTIWRPKSGN